VVSLPIVAVLIAWSLFWDRTDFVPSPASTIATAIGLLQEPETYTNLLDTARRLVLGLGLGFGAAVLVSLVMRQSPWWRRFFAPYVFATISTPSLAIALFSLMVFGLSEVGIYIAVGITIFPFAVVSLLEGLDNLDARLGQMASVYGFSWLQRVRNVAIPEMSPHLFAAFRNVHALAWKIVVIAEVFSQQTGVGYQYKLAYSFFELQRLLVWAALFITMVVIVEYGILRPMERVAFRWRRAEGGTSR
jgi:NitT/TauT family transport system permease protein